MDDNGVVALFSRLLDNMANLNIVSSFLPDEIEPTDNKTRKRWSREHTEQHFQREIMIPLKGDCLFGYKGKVYPCSPGTAFFIDSFDEHDSYYPKSGPNILHLWVSVLMGNIHANVLSIHPNKKGKWKTEAVVFLSEEESVNMLAYWNSFGDESLPEGLRRARILGTVTVLLSIILEKMLLSNDKKSDEPSIQEQAVNVICKHIEATAGRYDDLQSLANLAGYSKFYFLRVFQKHTGFTVKQYVDTCRMTKVQKLLEKGYSKTHIASELGFSCYSVFNRWLKKHGTVFSQQEKDL